MVLSLGEILLVAGVGILLLRPEDVPKLVRGALRLSGRFRQWRQWLVQLRRDTLDELARLDHPDAPRDQAAPGLLDDAARQARDRAQQRRP